MPKDILTDECNNYSTHIKMFFFFFFFFFFLYLAVQINRSPKAFNLVQNGNFSTLSLFWQQFLLLWRR